MTIDSVRYLNSKAMNGLNLYAYCGNNPTMAVDPNGTEWWNPATWDWDNIGNWSDVGRFVGGLVISLAGLGLMALSIKSGKVASLSPGITLGLSVALYGGFVMASSWDSEIKTDMARIHWNPFNTDDDMAMTNKVSFYKGQAVILQDFAGSSFSAGIMFLHQDQKGRKNTVKHEWGHFVQLLMFGPVLYAALFAAPSVAYWHYCKRTEDWTDYYNMPWEKLADDFGGVIRQ